MYKYFMKADIKFKFYRFKLLHILSYFVVCIFYTYNVIVT